MKSTNKTLIALAISMAAIGASAQVDKAASNAAYAAQHKVDQKRAEAKAADSGPIGKAVNNTKAEYHEKMAEKDTKDAKKALGVDNSKTMGTTTVNPSAAATDAKDAMQHKADQKRAEDKAATSGPVGKAVNNTKAEYHKGMAEKNKNDAKENLGIKSKRTPAVTNDSTMPATTGEGGPGINNGTPPVTRPSGNS